MKNYNNTKTIGGIRIEFISDGWRQILNSQAVADVVNDAGQKIAQRAGEGFVYKPQKLHYGGGRVGGFISAQTIEARRAEATSKTLTKAVNGG